MYNQAFNQGKYSSKAAVEREKERTRIVSGCRSKGNIMSSILSLFVEIIITFPEDHVHLSMRFSTKTRVFRHPVIKRVIGHSIKGERSIFAAVERQKERIFARDLPAY